MNHPVWHWALAAAALVAGYGAYGWPGVALAFTAIVFWLLLQFNRAVRVMRSAGEAPIGRIDSAVMLNAKLQPGLVMIDVLKLTRSLGERQAEGADVWRWCDEGGSAVRLSFENGRLATWVLERPSEAA